MKILVYFPGDVNESKGTPIRVKNVVEQLIVNGAEVYYSGPTRPDNVNITKYLKSGSPLSRIFSLSDFVRKNKVDVVYIQTSAALWLVPFFKLLTNSKVGLDFHSLRIEEEKVYKNLGYFSYTFKKIVELLLSLFLDFATGVSKPLGDYYKSVVLNYHVLPGGVDLNLFNNDVQPDKEILLWKGDSILIGYAGNTKWYQGLDTCLSSLINLKNKGENFKLVIIASSVELDVAKYIEDNDISSLVKVIGKRPHSDIPSLLKSADVLTIVRPSDMVTEYAFPSKFPEHAALGVPLVISKVGDAGNYVTDGISGIVVRPNSPEDLSNALLRLKDSSLRDKLGIGAFNLAKETFDINLLGKNLYNFILKQCNHKK